MAHFVLVVVSLQIYGLGLVHFYKCTVVYCTFTMHY